MDAMQVDSDLSEGVRDGNVGGEPERATARRELPELLVDRDRRGAASRAQLDLLDARLQAAELEVRAAQAGLERARRARLLGRRERELLLLQAAHSRCPTSISTSTHKPEPGPSNSQLRVHDLDPVEGGVRVGGGGGDAGLALGLSPPLAPQGEDAGRWRARWEADMALLDLQLAEATAELESGAAALRAEQSLRQQQEEEEGAAAAAQQQRLVQLEEQLQQWEDAHRDCASRVRGEVLPDEALLQVFRLLPLECVALTAARVCSAWRRVSKDRSLWRDAELRLSENSSRKDVAFARFAPRCKSLYLQVMNDVHVNVYRMLLQRETPIIAPNVVLCFGLSLAGYTSWKLPAAQVLLDVLNSQRNHIQKLEVSGTLETALHQAFWESVVSMNLRELVIDVGNNEQAEQIINAARHVDFSNLRLENLEIDAPSISRQGVVPRILVACRDSLREVELCVDRSCDPEIIHDLGLCRYLRKVCVPAVDNIGALEACGDIQELAVTGIGKMAGDRVQAYQGISQLLDSLSNQLTDLRLELSSTDGLALTARSEMLCLKSFAWNIFCDTSAARPVLVEFLQRSPVLERLDLNPEDIDLLLPTGDTVLAPTLRVLIVDNTGLDETNVDPTNSLVKLLVESRPQLDVRCLECMDGTKSCCVP